MPKIINEDDVFKAVIELLVARGYDRATTSDLAAAANMHEATLFRKYGSKVGLIEQAIEHQLATTPMSQVSYTGNLRADLMAILEAYVATVAMYGEIMPMLLLEIPRHPELRETLHAPLANVQGIMRILERYQAEGLLQNEPPLITVNVLLAPIMVHEMFRRVRADLAAEIDLEGYVDAFLQGRGRG
ncbi:MAG: TetR/AcrR family transcriptional regulator [Ardenticatenaceae bacterium]|nr:TetR/AcrR family transcriptional regulator [Ardenticatenaceae bacterium]